MKNHNNHNENAQIAIILRRAARILDANQMFREAEALDFVLVRIASSLVRTANNNDMQEAGGLYGAVGNMNALQDTALGKGIATARPGQSYYGQGASVAQTGPKITPGMTSEQIANAKMQWFQQTPGWHAMQSQLRNQQYGDYYKSIGFADVGDRLKHQGDADANGVLNVPNEMPMPTTYSVPPLQ